MSTLGQRLQVLAVAGTMLVGGYFLGASAKSYQVTGDVVKFDDKMVVVEKKDGEKWELNLSDKTKIEGKLKDGVKVTIKYTMTATDIEVK
jgi:hypothetical protein